MHSIPACETHLPASACYVPGVKRSGKKTLKNNRCAASKKQFTISVDNYVNNPRNIAAYTHPAARLFVTIKK